MDSKINNKNVKLKLSKISKSFGSVIANKDVSLDVYEGEILSLLGENGSGKTTLLNIIAGTITEDTGKVSIRKGATIGYLRQNIENKNY